VVQDAFTGLPVVSYAVARPFSQSMTALLLSTSDGPPEVGQPSDNLVPIMSTDTNAYPRLPSRDVAGP
jgi:hypothetical protein